MGSRRVQCRQGDVWPVAGGIDWDGLGAFFDFGEELHPPDAFFPFAPTFERCFSVFAVFVCECGVVAECDGGLDAQAGEVSERLADEFNVELLVAASSFLDLRVDSLYCVHACSSWCFIVCVYF